MQGLVRDLRFGAFGAWALKLRVSGRRRALVFRD